MATQVTDKFIEGKARLAGKVGAGGVASTSATTIPHTFVGLTEGNVYIVTANRTDTTGVTKNAVGSTETFIGIVSSTNFISCVRAVEGTAQAWAADTVLEILFTATGWNTLIEGILVEHGQDGTHDKTKVVDLSTAQTLTNKTLTSPKINEDVAVTSTATEINLLHGKTALGAFWTSFSGAYASATTITVSGTDVTGIFKKGVVLKWLKSDNTFKTGMVISSSYSSPNTTITIIGSTVESGDKSFYYGGDALIETFIIPGTLGAVTDGAKTWYCPTPSYPLGCDAHVKTAGTTNATEFDINDDGTSLFNGTAASIASGATSDLANAAYTPATVIAADSIITVDINSVSTTAPVEAYLQLYYYPQWWVGRT